MPTPFTHLAVAQRLLDDPAVSDSSRSFLNRERSAYLLGNIAADARISDGVTRETTHFFAYDRPIDTHPWRVMLAQYPDLQHVSSTAQQAFLAGYIAHLSMDEVWSLEMVRPYFADGMWGNRRLRFLMLHIILIYMDERDYGRLEGWQQSTLCAARPHQWTPFLSDAALVDWRDFIGSQIPPQGDSQTLQVLGERLNMEPAALREILDDDQRMQSDLWANVPQILLSEVETHMYDHARSQMMVYLNGR